MGEATFEQVDRDGLMDFVRPRNDGILITTRTDGRPQASPVTLAVVGDRIMVSSYPDRAKVKNIRRDKRVSMCVLSAEFTGPWVQFDGTAEVIALPAGLEQMVAYYRAVMGEHPDWDAYRASVQADGKVLIRITVDRWGPIASGGWPAGVRRA